MIRLLIGFTAGVYVAQNYNIPNIKSYFKMIQTTLEEYEKDLSKKP